MENWDHLHRTEIRGVGSELKGLISDLAKTFVIMNKAFKNTCTSDRVSRSPTPRRGVIQAGNSYKKDTSTKLTSGPSMVTEVKYGGSFPITKTEGRTQRSGTASPSEMGKVHIRRWEGKLV